MSSLWSVLCFQLCSRAATASLGALLLGRQGVILRARGLGHWLKPGSWDSVPNSMLPGNLPPPVHAPPPAPLRGSPLSGALGTAFALFPGL